MTSEITIPEELYRFIKEHTNDYYLQQLIMFFTDHPYAQFNELAIIHALNQDGGRRCVQEALRNLVDKGIIKTCIDSNVPLYSLPANMQSLVLELAKLEPRQRQLLLWPNFVKEGEVPIPALGNGSALRYS